jgi:hypothetical protein
MFKHSKVQYSTVKAAAINASKDSRSSPQHCGSRTPFLYNLSPLPLCFKLYQQRFKLCGCGVEVYCNAVGFVVLRVVML